MELERQPQVTGRLQPPERILAIEGRLDDQVSVGKAGQSWLSGYTKLVPEAGTGNSDGGQRQGINGGAGGMSAHRH